MRGILYTKDMMIISILFFVVIVSCVLRMIGISDNLPNFMIILWSLVILIIVAEMASGLREDGEVFIYFLTSFFIKFFLLVTDTFCDGMVMRIFRIGDSINFENIALSYYHGDFSKELTNFPYFLNAEYQIFGPNVFNARLINILMSMTMLYFVAKIFTTINVTIKYKRAAIIVAGLSPYVFIYSIALLREATYMCFLTWSFYCFVKWSYKRDIKELYMAIALSMPAVFMNDGYFAFTAIYLLCLAKEYLKLSQRNLKKLIFRIWILIGFFGGIFYLYRISATSYLININSGGLLNRIQSGYFAHLSEEAGSAYLTWMPLHSWSEFILYTPLRIFYFMFSPLIMDWRGWKDAITFFFDSMIHLCCILYCIQGMGFLKKDFLKHPREVRTTIGCGVMIILCSSFVFCWGTISAGTAIRHRVVLYGVEAIMIGVKKSCLKRKLESA